MGALASAAGTAALSPAGAVAAIIAASVGAGALSWANYKGAFDSKEKKALNKANGPRFWKAAMEDFKLYKEKGKKGPHHVKDLQEFEGTLDDPLYRVYERAGKAKKTHAKRRFEPY